jgi:hypothetical protein
MANLPETSAGLCRGSVTSSLLKYDQPITLYPTVRGVDVVCPYLVKRSSLLIARLLVDPSEPQAFLCAARSNGRANLAAELEEAGRPFAEVVKSMSEQNIGELAQSVVKSLPRCIQKTPQ